MPILDTRNLFLGKVKSGWYQIIVLTLTNKPIVSDLCVPLVLVCGRRHHVWPGNCLQDGRHSRSISQVFCINITLLQICVKIMAVWATMFIDVKNVLFDCNHFNRWLQGVAIHDDNDKYDDAIADKWKVNMLKMYNVMLIGINVWLQGVRYLRTGS